MTEPLLRIDGEVSQQLELTFEDLQAFPEGDQVQDVSRFHPKRQGDGVRLSAILERVDPKPSVTYLTLHATSDSFAASIPLEAVRDEGIIVYQLDGEALPVSSGGPIRFLIRDPVACHTGELDDCANVKFVDRIELTTGKGRDTRSEDDQEHDKLQRSQS